MRESLLRPFRPRVQKAGTFASRRRSSPHDKTTITSPRPSSRCWTPPGRTSLAETDYFGPKCLAARRLLERGVRFVQIWSGSDNGFPRCNWDSHEDIAKDHGEMGRSMDKPAAALLK